MSSVFYVLMRCRRSIAVAALLFGGLLPLCAEASAVPTKVQQRYPWNGLVDVEIYVDSSKDSNQVELVVTDKIGNTNVTCQSFIVNGVPTSSICLPSGYTTIQWVASSDLPAGFNSQIAVGAVSGSSKSTPDVKYSIDMRGLGPWQRHTAAETETLTFSSAWATNAASGAKAVVKVMPVLKEKPKYIVIDLSGGTTATQYGVSYLDEVPGGSWSDEYKTSKLVLRHIPAGSFIMGGRATDYPGAVNTNLHMVTITRDFYMGVFELTQRQWELVMGTRPSVFSNETCYATRPVECVRWVDVRGNNLGIQWPKVKQVDETSFMGVIRGKTGLSGLDISTEAQWEYACRAGATTALNSGKNLSNMTNDVEMAAVGRYAWNSGLNGVAFDRFQWITNHLNAVASIATASVGTYSANAFGLYDMHGNVAEWCLDRFADYATCYADPVGGEYEEMVDAIRIYRGGSWWHGADQCLSGFRSAGDTAQDGSSEGYKKFGGYLGWPSVGFRLCLQGGDIPDFAAASTLENASAAGTYDWTPSQAGTYYLTHETMNGTTNAQLLSAWFEVAGCNLEIEPQGELTNGVRVAINGADEEWTVYYTVDGSAPSKSSNEYAEPFALPKSGTLRAVAYNAKDMASEEVSATFTLHDALSVVGAVARPRYPWNGIVDVDLELKGDGESKYKVEVEAKDLVGGTNLTVKTVTGDMMLAPGNHRLTWGAAADIARDFDFSRVAVTVKATGSALLGYSRQFGIAVDGYAGAETLTDVPVLVRLSDVITGFHYQDFASPSNGADLAFFGANENALPFEIDEWNTNGESLVWVKLPTLAKGTMFTCAYGNRDAIGTIASTERDGMKHEVWSGYAGVWHMNEDSGTAYDSSVNGLDALATPGTNELADVGLMTSYAGAPSGRGRICARESQPGGTFFEVPSYDAMELGGQFVISGWMYYSIDHVATAGSIFSRKNGYKDTAGFQIEFAGGTLGHNWACARGASKWTPFYYPHSFFVTNWVSVAYQFNGDNIDCYTNGVFCAPTTDTGIEETWCAEHSDAATDNGLSLAIGGNPDGRARTFPGSFDEVRLRGGLLSPARIKADYDMIANKKFCTYGPVSKEAE